MVGENMRKKNIIGKKFGDWLVVAEATPRNDQSYWTCKCVCGNKNEVARSSLVQNRSKGCGCKRADRFQTALKNGTSCHEHRINSIQLIRKDGIVKYKKNRISHLFERAYKSSILYRKNGKHNNVITFKLWKALVVKPCVYCGAIGSRIIKDYGSRGNLVSLEFIKINSIDRIDSTIPYVFINCQPCCITCNTAKLDRNHEEFIKWISKVYRHLNLLERC